MKFINRQKIITNIYRIQAYDSIMCGYFCIGFINFMFNGRSLTDEYHDIGTHWVALYVHNKIITYFDSFGVEHIPKEIMKKNGQKIITNIYRIQAYDSIMCGYFLLDSLILCLMVKA